MSFFNQKTIAQTVSCFGTSLHSGNNVNLRLCPAPVDSGVVFRKVTKAREFIIDIPASYNAVSNTLLNTTLRSEDGKEYISTVEHLMAAIWGCDIDNLIVEVDGDELPIMDGSSEHFVFLLECAGIKKQNKGRKVVEVLKTINVSEGGAYASISPADGFSVTMEIDYKNQHISSQKGVFHANTASFKMDLARARTFGLEEEVRQMRDMGRAKGGSLDNAIVVSDNGVLNKEGLRYKDEFVRHKMLDSIGDLYLAGYMKGHFHGFKSGHKLNNKLLKEFFKDKDAWRVVEMPCEIESPSFA